jgi:hypothetical protein
MAADARRIGEKVGLGSELVDHVVGRINSLTDEEADRESIMLSLANSQGEEPTSVRELLYRAVMLRSVPVHRSDQVLREFRAGRRTVICQAKEDWRGDWTSRSDAIEFNVYESGALVYHLFVDQWPVKARGETQAEFPTQEHTRRLEAICRSVLTCALAEEDKEAGRETAEQEATIESDPPE